MNPWGSYNGSYSWATPSDEYNPSYPAMNLPFYNPQSSNYPQQQKQQGYFPNKKEQNIQKIKASPVSVKKETITPKRVGSGGSAVQKRHTVYQNGAWNGDWSNIRGSVGNRGGRGGGGRGRGARNGRGKFFGPTNKKTDIPFVILADNAPALSLSLSADNIIGFHGFDSVFTTQHTFPVLVEGQIYTSCDHYYQCKKVLNLTGSVCESLLVNVRDEAGVPITTVSSSAEQQKSFSQMAKEALKAANIEKSVVEKWRTTKGLAAIQTALLAKVSQSAHLREALKETSDNLLVHAFRGDSIYGTGCGVPKIKQWVEDLRSSGVRQIRVPGEFPLTETTVQGCPVIAEGRNILGVILMLLREKIRKNEIEVVDMTELFNKLRTHPAVDEKMDLTAGNEPITL